MRITVVAAGTRGDVEPHFALALALMRRGHDVSVCAPIDFEAQAHALGIAFRPIRVSFRALYDSADGAALLASDGSPLSFYRVLKRVIIPVADQAMRDIQEACAPRDALPPELICYSVLAVPAYYCARDMGIPAIATCLQPLGRTRAYASPLYPFEHRLPGPLNHLTHVLAEELLWQMYRPLLRRRWRTGLPLTRHFATVYASENPMLFAYSPALMPRPAEYRPWMHVTGFWRLGIADGWTPTADLVDFLASGPAPVCIGFGSMNSPRVRPIIERALDTLAARGKRAIVLTGWWHGDLAPRSREDVYVADAVPHDWLLSRVSAVIHHGGAGTTMAALRAGAPSVIVPFFFDQRFWGRTLHRLGLGPAPLVARDVSRADLDRRIDEIEATPEFNQRLRFVARQLGAENGVARAVDVIEESMEAWRPRVVESTS